MSPLCLNISALPGPRPIRPLPCRWPRAAHVLVARKRPQVCLQKVPNVEFVSSPNANLSIKSYVKLVICRRARVQSDVTDEMFLSKSFFKNVFKNQFRPCQEINFLIKINFFESKICVWHQSDQKSFRRKEFSKKFSGIESRRARK